MDQIRLDKIGCLWLHDWNAGLRRTPGHENWRSIGQGIYSLFARNNETSFDLNNGGLSRDAGEAIDGSTCAYTRWFLMLCSKDRPGDLISNS
jgi:hypothetical protein